MFRRTTVTLIALVALAGCGSSGKSGSGTAAGPGSASGSAPAASGAPGASTGAGGATGGGGSGSGNGGTGTGTGGSACIVGSWKSTAVSGTLAGDGVTGTVKGGSGITLTVSPNGASVVKFDGMQPLSFNYTVGGGSVTGTAAYGGSASGTMKISSNTWSPAGTADFSKVTATVDITNPAVGRVADKQPLADFVGTANSTGAAIDGSPVLKPGSFTCNGSTLTIAPPAGTVGSTWTLTKA